MAKVIIQYEAETASLKASVSEINKVNDEVVKSAQDSSKKVADAYKQTGQAAAAAFASGGVKKALDDQNASIAGVTAKLKLLYDEEIKLLEQGKKATARYVENQKEAARLRDEVDKLTKATTEQSKAIDAQTNKAKSLTGQLRGYREELSRLEQEGKETTQEFQQIALAAARLEDQIGDTRERVRVLASDTFTFDAAIDATQQLAGAFSVVQGATALFAEDSEELQEAIAKTNAALAILNGLQQVNAFVTGQSAAKLAVTSAAQSAYSVVVGTSTGALKAFRIALAATGVGLLVIGLAALVENFDKVKQAAFNSIPGLEQFVLGVGNAIDAVKEFFGIIDEQSRPNLAERFIKNEQRRVEAAVNATQRRIQLAQAEGKETFRLEIEKEQIVLDSAKRKLAFLQANAKALAAIPEAVANLEFELQQEILDRETNIQALRLQNARKQVAAIQSLNTINLQSISIKEKEKKLTLDQQANLNAIENTIKTAQLNFGDTQERRIALILNEEQIRKKAAEDSIKDENERATAIELITAETQEKIRQELKATRDAQIQNLFEIARGFVDLFTQLGALSAQLTENRIAGIEEAQQVELAAINNTVATERQKQREREALELRTSRRIAQEKVKQARLDKAIALFGAVVNTAEAITKALPNVVLAGIAGVLGAAQIATIAARPIPKFEKGGAVGGRRHSSGGTLIEAEKDEFITRRQQSIRHRSELEAINNSTASFNRLIEQKYIRPAIERYMVNSARQNLTVKASLNSKSMEKKLDKMSKSMRQPVIVNINGKDNRYSWQ